MAESVVSFAIEKLATFLTSETELIGNLPSDVKALQNELGSIKVVLKDAEKKAEEDDAINEWLSQLKPKHDLSSDIKAIKSEIVEINNRRERYRFMTTNEVHSGEICSNWQGFSLFKDEAELFGFERHKEAIIRLLKQDDHVKEAEGPRTVIAVVGMGGVGKTTLIRKVYENKEVKEWFNVHAWVTVSQSYKRMDLMKSICNQVLLEPSVQVDVSDEETVITKLRNHLHKKRYIVVLDDVWDANLWEYVQITFPSNSSSSRILMTTRDKHVALAWKDSSTPHHIHEIKPLNEEAAWGLFCHKSFGNDGCPPELEKLSRQILEKCEGLPLAIVAIAGLLFAKQKTISEWNKLQHSLGSELGSNPHFSSTTKVLLLSYHELPYHLKPCFLYLGMFPEDYSFRSNRLVRLWIAEGLVQKRRGKTLEEVAEEYLIDLTNRSLVQVHEKYSISERPKTRFRVHDIQREMIILPKLDRLCFCQVLSENNYPTTKQFRRLSVCTDDLSHYNFTEAPINIRSLLWFSNMSEPFMGSFLNVSRLLKVLDLEDSPIDHIPEELGNLRHLQYLSVRNTNVRTLPKAIGELSNLQTLDLKQCLVEEFPREIGKCHKLRHLFTYPLQNVRLCASSLEHHFWYYKQKTKGVKFPEDVLRNFSELQKLARLEVDRPCLISELQHLDQLRRLEITNFREVYGKELCIAVEKMKHLRSLSIQSQLIAGGNDYEMLDLQYITSPPLLLERLYLGGRLEKLPMWIFQIQTLAKLELAYSRLKDEAGFMLNWLPNLVDLTLYEAYDGANLYFPSKKLKILLLYGLAYLQNVSISMPNLQTLLINGCPNLWNVHIQSHISNMYLSNKPVHQPIFAWSDKWGNSMSHT